MEPGLLAVLAFGGLFLMMAVLPTQLRKRHQQRGALSFDESVVRAEGAQAMD